jgi:Protein of unknown function (DUF3800)
MGTSYVVYIDESGDEGLHTGMGASEWFVLSGVITRANSDLTTVKLVDRVRSILGRPDRKPLHFRDLRHEHRLPFVEHIARASLRAVTVLIHKRSVLKEEIFQEPHRLYFFAVRQLLARVSWLCRDHHRPAEGDGTAEIVFSNRSGMSYTELGQYLELLKTRVPPTSIDWSVIRCDQISAHSAGRRMGLQIADAVASGFFKAVEPTRFGHTEDRYARMLKSIVYHRERCYKGYGLKFWPREVDRSLGTEERFRWFREIYLKDNRTESGNRAARSRSRASGSHPV